MMKGAYLLVMDLQKERSVAVGRLGVIEFQKGYYIYVGSALNGLEQRIERHLRQHKKTHWHIDYLLPFTRVMDVFYKESPRREECRIALEFERTFSYITGFGCSDCSCESHLFHGVPQDLYRRIDSLDMEQYRLHKNP
jgi:Uri superfamily endonuclease